jgi:hypothetical protein
MKNEKARGRKENKAIDGTSLSALLVLSDDTAADETGVNGLPVDDGEAVENSIDGLASVTVLKPVGAESVAVMVDAVTAAAVALVPDPMNAT